MKNMPRVKKNRFVGCLAFGIFFLFITSTQAAEPGVSLNIRSTASEVGTKQDLVVTIFMENPGTRPINAIDTTLLVPKNYFEVKELWLGDSIVPLWLKEPEVEETESAWLIPLSGVIPGGTAVENGELMRMVLTSRILLGTASIRLLSPQVFFHNRTADSLELQTIYAEIEVVPFEEAGQIQEIIVLDEIPPEPFVPIVASDATLYGGDYFLMFQTIDRQSGLSHFELIETDIYYEEEVLIEDKNLWWKQVENPYRLVDQDLSSYIYIKAVDRHGNARVVVIPPTNNLKKSARYSIISALVVLVVLGGLSLVWGKKIKHVAQNENE